jgi:integrating conjugative element protein (TIGR03761 family)
MPNTTNEESVHLNLGALRAAMSLTLHTHHASRIWHGRRPSGNRPGIIGLNGFVYAMNKMKRGAEQDDPYSDLWMLRIENKLAQTKTRLQALREQIATAFASIPPALSIGDNLNVQPVRLPLFIGSPLGFLAVYLLVDYDELVRKLMLAHHVALIDRHTLEDWLKDSAHALRSLFALAQRYQYAGVSREDFAAHNAAAAAAVEKYGPMPEEVLNGTRRSGYAPPLRRADSGTPDRGEAHAPETHSTVPDHDGVPHSNWATLNALATRAVEAETDGITDVDADHDATDGGPNDDGEEATQ